MIEVNIDFIKDKSKINYIPGDEKYVQIIITTNEVKDLYKEILKDSYYFLIETHDVRKLT